MYREIYLKLLEWKKEKGHKPLVLTPPFEALKVIMQEGLNCSLAGRIEGAAL